MSPDVITAPIAYQPMRKPQTRTHAYTQTKRDTPSLVTCMKHTHTVHILNVSTDAPTGQVSDFGCVNIVKPLQSVTISHCLTEGGYERVCELLFVCLCVHVSLYARICACVVAGVSIKSPGACAGNRASMGGYHSVTCAVVS